MQIADARQYFEEMGCSHFHMSREDPSRYSQYCALGISTNQERGWRRDCINAAATALMAAQSPEWHKFTSMIDLCESQGDSESLQTLVRTIDAVIEGLSPKDGVIVAESLIGTAAYHYDQGPIHAAVKLKQEPVARQLADYALSLATRPEARKAEPARSAAAARKCAAVKAHFKLSGWGAVLRRFRR